MITIPSELKKRFDERMRQKAIPAELWWQYQKWLRYYLDFCIKYNHATSQKESLPLFLQKLKEKKQTDKQREQAANAIQLYRELSGNLNRTPQAKPTTHANPAKPDAPTPGSSTGRLGSWEAGESKTFSKDTRKSVHVSNIGSEPVQPNRDDVDKLSESAPFLKEARRSYKKTMPENTRLEKTSAHVPSMDGTGKGASWVSEYKRLTNEIKVRHYSPKTLQTYTGWVRKFQTFTHSKDPATLSTEDVKRYLTFLAKVEKPTIFDKPHTSKRPQFFPVLTSDLLAFFNNKFINIKLVVSI